MFSVLTLTMRKTAFVDEGKGSVQSKSRLWRSLLMLTQEKSGNLLEEVG